MLLTWRFGRRHCSDVLKVTVHSLVRLHGARPISFGGRRALPRLVVDARIGGKLDIGKDHVSGEVVLDRVANRDGSHADTFRTTDA